VPFSHFPRATLSSLKPKTLPPFGGVYGIVVSSARPFFLSLNCQSHFPNK